MKIEELMLTDDEIKEKIKKYNLPEVSVSPRVIEVVKQIIAIVRAEQLAKIQRLAEEKPILFVPKEWNREWADDNLEYAGWTFEDEVKLKVSKLKRGQLEVIENEWP